MLNRWSQEKVSTRLAASLLQFWRVDEGGVWLSTLCRGCCAASMAAGPFSLFKGMASPLVTASFVNAIVFASYNETMKVTRPSRCIRPWKAAWVDDRGANVLSSQMLIGQGEKRKPTYSEVFWGGAMAGVVQSSINCPSEVVKCRLQVSRGRAVVCRGLQVQLRSHRQPVCPPCLGPGGTGTD